MKIITNDPFHLTLQNFTSLTSKLIVMGEFELLEASFNIIEELLKGGEPPIKSLLGIIIFLHFIYSWMNVSGAIRWFPRFPFFFARNISSMLKIIQVYLIFQHLSFI